MTDSTDTQQTLRLGFGYNGYRYTYLLLVMFIFQDCSSQEGWLHNIQDLGLNYFVTTFQMYRRRKGDLRTNILSQ